MLASISAASWYLDSAKVVTSQLHKALQVHHRLKGDLLVPKLLPGERDPGPSVHRGVPHLPDTGEIPLPGGGIRKAQRPACLDLRPPLLRCPALLVAVGGQLLLQPGCLPPELPHPAVGQTQPQQFSKAPVGRNHLPHCQSRYLLYDTPVMMPPVMFRVTC